MSNEPVALGLDFGTESVRALLVTLRGEQLASASVDYRHGQITEALPTSGERLPPHSALQHPGDWLDSSAEAVRTALADAAVNASRVISIGVDFTSCTMLPTRGDGTPLCLLPKYQAVAHAWPKLWKHHGAVRQTERINAVARERDEPWLMTYGGVVGLEWFFPKVLEVLENAPAIYEAADVWLEAGDWYVWQLVGGTSGDLPRSTCQAGYKAQWDAADGYPSRSFFAAVNPQLADVVDTKMPGRMCAPGALAGRLTSAAADHLGLVPGIAVSAATIDAHAGVPGAGAADPGTLVMVMGTSSCHMLNAVEHRAVAGVAGIVKDGILPGYYGYETGQAAVGDGFDWTRRLLGHADFDELTTLAAALPPGADGVTCVDWMNGCRTPLMDGRLRGTIAGLTLNHGPGHVYRAGLEASAFGLRWIVDLLREQRLPVERFVATGGLPRHSPLLVQIYADVLNEPIEIASSAQGPALGAAILGALAAGEELTGFADARTAIRSMSGKGHTQRYEPDPDAAREYRTLYRRYRELADYSARFVHSSVANNA